ncbi:MAG: glycoside hydrolase family 2 protein [Fimbriimonadaceae bacterium]|nr:glycoside hydrolase family 2 protein [Fimbriimonadaceae bacterium]
MKVTFLHEGWTLSLTPSEVGFERPHFHHLPLLPAIVPGCVHLDLIAAGVIADPFKRMYEYGCQWVDDSEWTYEIVFDWSPSASQQRLMFEGLDTFASVFLNGSHIAKSDNHFLPVKCDVTGILKSGENRLRIEFLSAIREGLRHRVRFCEESHIDPGTVFFDERAFVRKPSYAFGWDWGPRLVGAGIFAPVRLIEFDERIEAFDVTVSPRQDGDFAISASARPSGGEVRFSIELGGDAKIQSDSCTEEGAEWVVSGGLWWPNELGEQTLHRVRCELHVSGELVESQSRTVGLRTVEFLRETDEVGESFEFRVNGRPVFARGANWIPSDSFLALISDDKIEAQVALAARLGMNMLRVWGGGQYESEAFYDACDRHGVLVWQDFPYACSYYPDDESHLDQAKEEAEFHIKRLRHRASLALWCGNNENLIMWQTKWGDGVQPSRMIGERIFAEVLPAVVGKLDPARSYIASSPIGTRPGPTGPNNNVNQDHFGDSHYWDVWHGRGDWIHYRESFTRFSSEFGFASAASLATYQSCLTGEEREEFPSTTFRHHDKTKKPWETFTSLVERHYPVAQSLEEWVYFSQLNQRDALRCGIEHFRTYGECRGTLIWQYNDCWPVQSWAVQDSLGYLKPAGFELRRLYDDVMVTTDFSPGDTELRTSVVNDSLTHYSGEVEVRVWDTLKGEFVEEQSWSVSIDPNSVSPVALFDLARFESTRTAVELKLGTQRSRWVLLSEPKEMQLRQPNITAVHKGKYLEITTDAFVVDLVIWDENDFGAIRSESFDEPGWDPVTSGPGICTYRSEIMTERLVGRSLYGGHEIRVLEG